jgi:hypothetical protein
MDGDMRAFFTRQSPVVVIAALEPLSGRRREWFAVGDFFVCVGPPHEELSLAATLSSPRSPLVPRVIDGLVRMAGPAQDRLTAGKPGGRWRRARGKQTPPTSSFRWLRFVKARTREDSPTSGGVSPTVLLCCERVPFPGHQFQLQHA